MGRYSKIASKKAAGGKDQLIEHEGTYLLVLTEGAIFESNDHGEMWKARRAIRLAPPRATKGCSAPSTREPSTRERRRG